MNMTNFAAVAGVCVASVAAAQNIELTTNGGFETGDTSGWEYFPSGPSTFAVTGDANTGNFAGVITNTTPVTNPLIKQANIGIGQVSAGQEVTISFAAKGSSADGGVAFAEFFSELDGGGVSSAEILGGGPLALTDEWTTFTFTAFAGPDVSGGITLQLAAITGGAPNSVSTLFVDDVSVSIIPTPGSFAVLGLAGLAATRRRR